MKATAILFASLIAVPALANANRVGAVLRGYTEVPSVNSTAHGTFVANVASDGQSFDYTLTFDGLKAPVQQAHIHFAQKSVNGPIIVWLCGTSALPGPAGTPTCPQSGTVTGTVTAANVLASPSTQQLAAGDLADLIAAMRAEAAYVNVHTTASPGGEIRGQVFRLW